MKALKESGFTIFELLATMGVLSIMSATVVYNVKSMNNPLTHSSFAVEQYLHTARARALKTTSVIKVYPSSATTLSAGTSSSCDATMTPVSNLNLTLPKGAGFIDTTWSICFDQRGFADQNISFVIANAEGESRNIKVALGGGTTTDR